MGYKRLVLVCERLDRSMDGICFVTSSFASKETFGGGGDGKGYCKELMEVEWFVKADCLRFNEEVVGGLWEPGDLSLEGLGYLVSLW